MICKNCGAELADDAVFCGTCGAAVEKEAAVEAGETTVLEMPTVEAVETAAPVEEVFAPQAVAVEAPAPAPKKKKGKALKVLIPVVAVVAAVAVAAVLFWPTIQGFAIKTFGSPEDYLTHVETNTLGGYVDSVTNVYDSLFIKGLQMNQFAEATVDIELGDKALDLLKDAAGMDMDWINGLGIKASVNAKETAEQINLALNLDDQQILSVDAIIDMANAALFVGVPELGNKYLSADMTEMGMAPAAFEEMEEALALVQKIAPPTKDLNKILNKYVGIAVSAMGEVEKGSETVEVGDIEQKLTTLEVEISEETAVNVAIAVLTELKDDKDVQEIFTNAVDAMVEGEFVDDDMDAEELWEEVTDGIDDALEELEDMKADDEAIITLTDYVNDKHEVVGRLVEVEGQEVIRYATVYKGKNFETELVIADGQAEFTGNGTRSGDAISGTFTLTATGHEVGTITVEGFDTEKFAKGYLNGTFTVEPSKELLEAADLSMVGIASPALEIKATSDEKASSLSIALLAGDEMLATVNITGAVSEGKDISVPSDSMDMDDAEEWLEDADFSKVLSNLKKAGVPADIVDALEMLLSGDMSNMFGAPQIDYDDMYSSDVYADYSDMYF